jgi:hypothetical protein
MNMPNDALQNTANDDWAAAMAEQTQASATVTSIDPTPGKPKPGQAALF